MAKKLAVVVTHPIQYYSPLFRRISASGKIQLKVFYTWSQASGKKYDAGFGKEVEWDIPLLEGYDFTFVNNTSSSPGSTHFKGIINPTLIKEIEDWNPSALLVIGWNFHSHLKAMRYFKGKKPIYFRGDSTLLDEKPGIKKIARRIYLKWIYKNIDYAFYVGQRNKEYFLANGIKEEQLIFAPHAIDNERFYDKDGAYRQRALDWRRSLGIKDDDIVYLFAGKLEPKKNPLLLLSAFLELKNPIAHLIFIGSGILEKELKNNVTLSSSKCDDQSIKKNIHFLDFQNQNIMPVVYRLGNIFVLASQSDTWGLSVNEAMACGLPVIVSSKVGCAVNLVKNSSNGFIFESGNEKELKQRMNDCLTLWMNDKNKLLKMGNDSLKIISDYSMENLSDNITNALLS